MEETENANSPYPSINPTSRRYETPKSNQPYSRLRQGPMICSRYANNVCGVQANWWDWGKSSPTPQRELGRRIRFCRKGVFGCAEPMTWRRGNNILVSQVRHEGGRQCNRRSLAGGVRPTSWFRPERALNVQPFGQVEETGNRRRVSCSSTRFAINPVRVTQVFEGEGKSLARHGNSFDRPMAAGVQSLHLVRRCCSGSSPSPLPTSCEATSLTRILLLWDNVNQHGIQKLERHLVGVVSPQPLRQD
jgi:hypothetical protein